jgi:hypothetical protein
MTNQKKKCLHCGSKSTLPIAYGLMSDEVHKKIANQESGYGAAVSLAAIVRIIVTILEKLWRGYLI